MQIKQLVTKIIVVSIYAFLLLSFSNFTVLAQPVSDLLPCDQYNTSVFDACGDVNSQITSVIRIGLTLVFSIIVFYGIFLIIKAALSIIRSEGDSSKIEAGIGIIKSVYWGIAMIFIGIVGIVIVLSFFGAQAAIGNINTPGNISIPLLTN
jgi:hypothetical protein